MSAFLVDKTHIDAMVCAGLVLARPFGPLTWWAKPPSPNWTAADCRDYRRELRAETAGRTGAMLWAANRASLDARYDEDELEPIYEYAPLPGTPDPTVMLSAVACFECQSCETPTWRTSEARSFCESLRLACIHRLPGYDRAPWEITDRGVFLSGVA